MQIPILSNRSLDISNWKIGATFLCFLNVTISIERKFENFFEKLFVGRLWRKCSNLLFFAVYLVWLIGSRIARGGGGGYNLKPERRQWRRQWRRRRFRAESDIL